MTNLSLTSSTLDFAALHASMQRHVDTHLLAGVSHAVLRGRDLVDLACIGWADREEQVALRPDHLFRVFSNTKLVTTCAVMLLLEEGRFALDDPVARWIPQLAALPVLKPGATALTDTEPMHGAITIRHLLTHGAGLSYGLLDPGSLLFAAYHEHRVLHPSRTLAQMMDTLAGLPLLFQPGTSWEYSVSIDVLGRLVEIVSGEPLDAFMRRRIFVPLGMVDTGFVIAPAQQHRLTRYYVGADALDPTKPGLTPDDSFPYPGAWLRPAPRLDAGGGLISTLPDMLALLRGLLPGSPTLLQPETIALMLQNHLPPGQCLRFAGLGPLPGKGFGLGGAVTLAPSSIESAASAGEFQWGGIAGTHWWISPRANVAALVMTQRQMGFWNPFFFEFKRHVHDALTR